MSTKMFETFSAEETFNIGRELAEKAYPGMIVCLNGDLGTGKTVFTQGFAAGLGIDEAVSSPTFTIVQEYNGRLPLHHFDVYRISDIDEMDEIGYEDCFYGDGVTLVEWAELIGELIPPEALQVTIRKDLEKGFDYRSIEITDRGEN